MQLWYPVVYKVYTQGSGLRAQGERRTWGVKTIAQRHLSKILPANRQFLAALTLAQLQTQKLALRAQTVCAAGVSLLEERLTKTRLISQSRILLNRLT
jgi:hypothetical protein